MILVGWSTASVHQSIESDTFWYTGRHGRPTSLQEKVKVKSTIAQDIAEIIVGSFSEYRDGFKAITAGAKRRFENAEWVAAKQASIERIELYDIFAGSVVTEIKGILDDSGFGDDRWGEVKEAYIGLIAQRVDTKFIHLLNIHQR